MLTRAVLGAQFDIWLTAERQTMSHPGALTAHLANRSEMLASMRQPIGSGRNLPYQKSESHIGSCATLARSLDNTTSADDEGKLLGVLAAKALKVAGGYYMRAGYFIPDLSPELYANTMIKLEGRDGDTLPPAGTACAELFKSQVCEEPRLADLHALLKEGIEGFEPLETELQDLANEDEAITNLTQFNTALELSLPMRSTFCSVAGVAIILQGAGFDRNGPLILEPTSDALANNFLRVGQIAYDANNRSVTSPDLVVRS